MSTLEDYIPEGEDQGAYGKDGFRDYVPAPETPKQEPQKNQQADKVAKKPKTNTR